VFAVSFSTHQLPVVILFRLNRTTSAVVTVQFLNVFNRLNLLLSILLLLFCILLLRIYFSLFDLLIHD
jgi:hypothetical protein